MSLITITLHPAIDRVVAIERLEGGGVLEGELLREVPAGKGVNTARTLRALSQPLVQAVVWAGTAEASYFRRALRAAGIQPALCLRPVPTRVCLTLLERNSRRETHLKYPMPTPSRTELKGLLEFLERLPLAGRAVALCGSAPPGVPSATLRRILSLLCRKAGTLIVDSSGELLAQAARQPLLGIKGNGSEFGAWLNLGRPLDPLRASDRKALGAALGGGRGQPRCALVTLGPRGALLAQDRRLWQAVPPRLQRRAIRSATGSGDAATAGWLAALASGKGPVQALQEAVAAGTAKVLGEDPGWLDLNDYRELLARIRVTELEMG